MNKIIKQVRHQVLVSHVKNTFDAMEQVVKTVVYFPVFVGILISLKLFGHTFMTYTFDETWPYLIVNYYKFFVDNYMEVIEKEENITYYDNKAYGEEREQTKKILSTRVVTDEYYLRNYANAINHEALKQVVNSRSNNLKAVNVKKHNMTQGTFGNVIYFPKRG